MVAWKDIQKIYSEYNIRKGFFRKLFRTKSDFMRFISDLIKDKSESDSVNQQDKFLLLENIIAIPAQKQTRLSYELALKIIPLCLSVETQASFDAIKWLDGYAAFNQSVFDAINLHDDAVSIFTFLSTISRRLTSNERKLLKKFASDKITVESFLTTFFVCFDDKVKSLYWCDKALSKEHAIKLKLFPQSEMSGEVLYFIAQRYEQGGAGIQNNQHALAFYQKAAEFDNQQALFRLGEAYQRCELGVEQDNIQSTQCYLRAIKSGNTMARSAIKEFAKQATKPFKYQLLRSVLKLLDNSLLDFKKEITSLCSDNEDEKVIDTLILFHQINVLNKTVINLIANHEKSRIISEELLAINEHLPLKNSQAMSMFALPNITIEGCLARLFTELKNKEKTCQWYEEGIKKQQVIEINNFPNNHFSSDILFFIGNTYEQYKVTSKSLECYQKAAHFGNPQALFKLGELYEKGNQIVEPNRTQATEYYKRAAILGNEPSRLSLKRLARFGDKTLKFILLQSILAPKDNRLDRLKSEITALCVENKKKAIFDVIVLFDNIKLLNYQFFSLIASHENAENIALDLLALNGHMNIKANKPWEMFRSKEISIEHCLAKMFIEIKSKEKTREWIKKAMINHEMFEVTDFPRTLFLSDILFFIAQGYDKDNRVLQDKERALAFYQKAATLSNTQAIMRLGELKQLTQNQTDTDTFIHYHHALNLGCRQAFPTLKRLTKSGPDNLQSQLTVFKRKTGALHLEANFEEQKNESLKNGK